MNPATAPAEGLAGYGGFIMGAMQLALPMSALREVVPCTALIALPCPAPGVVGAIDLRGLQVPVVDLRIVFGRPPGTTQAAVVIVMAHAGHLLGLLADTVTGIFAHAEGSASAAAYASAGPSAPAAAPGPTTDPVALGAAVYAGSIRRADTGALVSLLSAAGLARLPQVPLVPDPLAAAQAVAAPTQEIEPGARPRKMPVMLVRCGRLALAIDALAVHATLSDPKIHPSVLEQGACRGVIDYAAHRIPVVDVLQFCGLGRLEGSQLMQVFVLQFETGYVGLLVDAVIDVIDVDPQRVVAVPAFALPRPRLFVGALPADVLARPGSPAALAVHAPVPQYLLLDPEALRADAVMQGLSQTNTPLAPERADVAARTPARPASGAASGPSPGPIAHAGPRREWITYECFGEEATPIEQVAEILRYEPGSAVFEAQGAFLGLMINRGRSIPVMCLRRLAGAAPLPLDGDSSVLVVRVDSDWVGFAVPRLRAIESAQWSPELPSAGMGEGDLLAQALQSREMVLVKSGGGERMLRVLDLVGIARGLREQALAA